MSEYYTPKKTKGLFDPDAGEPFTLSRTGIDLFIECPRCFYLEKRLGLRRPPGFPFSLNAAVDNLLKKEFDAHRAKGEAHPMMKTYGIDAVPYADDRLDEWRDALRRGIAHEYKAQNLVIRGGIDDVWVNPKGELHIVDYKATAKRSEVSLDAEWQAGYKRQVEVYQWLFRQNGFPVSDTAYFVYCNGLLDAEAFDGKLEFTVSVIPYVGSDAWIPNTLRNIRKTLSAPAPPAANPECDYCAYYAARGEIESG